MWFEFEWLDGEVVEELLIKVSVFPVDTCFIPWKIDLEKLCILWLVRLATFKLFFVIMVLLFQLVDDKLFMVSSKNGTLYNGIYNFFDKMGVLKESSEREKEREKGGCKGLVIKE